MYAKCAIGEYKARKWFAKFVTPYPRVRQDLHLKKAMDLEVLGGYDALENAREERRGEQRDVCALLNSTALMRYFV